MRAAVVVAAGVLTLGLAACADINPGLGPYEAPGGPDVINMQGYELGSPADADALKLNQELIRQGQQREAEGLMP